MPTLHHRISQRTGPHGRRPAATRPGWPVVLAMFFLGLPAFAQAPPFEQRLKFSPLANPDPLSDSHILAIAQDPQGFMWFGTDVGGLHRYDGYELKVYQHELGNDRTLGHNYVVALLVDRGGTLWIGLNGSGLDRFDRDADTFIHYRRDPKDTNSFPHDSVRALYEDQAGALWIGGSSGLTRLDREAGTFFTYQHDPNDAASLSHNSVRAIFEDRETGLLWVGTRRGGLSSLDRKTGRFTHYQHDPQDPASLSDNGVNHIFKDRAGDFWISTQTGLNRFDPGSKTFVRYQHDPKNPDSVFGNIVVRTHEDTQERFWVATTTGLNRMDRAAGKFIRFRHVRGDPTSISDDSCRTLFEDDTGAMWFGTVNGGVSRLSAEPERFATCQHYPDDPASLVHDSVQNLYPDSQGRLWIATPGGLSVFDGRTFTNYRHDPDNPRSLSSDNVSAITEDAQGTVWIGAGGRLNRFDGRAFTRYPDGPADPGSLTRLNALCADGRGRLWIAVQDFGLACLEGQDVRQHRYARTNLSGVPSRYTYSMVRDQKGFLWLGTSDAGLVRLDPETATFTTYLLDAGHRESETYNRVYSMFLDRDGSFWVGANQGLFHFDPGTGTFTQLFTKDHGLPANAVLSVRGDSQGQLWLGTPAGLCRFDPKSGTVHSYDQSDGLQSSQFRRDVCAATPEGRMFFGGPNGLSAFYPGKIRHNPHVPPVVLTGFELFDQPMPTGGKDSPLQQAISVTRQITLRYDQSVFSFRFAALDYTSPQKNRYAYKMEGFDPDWRRTDAQRRFATYTKLDPGVYTFRVRASNNDGLWNEAGTSLKLIITPPWWATWWFRSVAAATVLGLAVGGYQWRVRSLERNQRELEYRVAERTTQLEAANKELEAFSYSVSHDLRAPLRGIDGFSKALLEEYMDKLDAEGQDYLQRVRRASQRMEGLIDDMLTLSHLSRTELHRTSVDLSALARDIVEELQTADPQRPVQFVITPALNVKADSSLIRIALENLLNNAWKYTRKHPTARIELGAHQENGDTVYFVRDDGAGFDMEFAGKLFGAFQRLHSPAEFQGTGVGLAIVQRIIHRHGGRVWAEGAVENGAVFYFTLPD